MHAVVRRAVAGSSARPIEAPEQDVAARASEVARALAVDVRDHEHQFRALLWAMLGNWLAGRRGEPVEDLPRGGRVAPIEAAIEGIRGDFGERDATRLARGLSMLIGIEGWVVLRDMWRLDDEEAVETVDVAVRWLVAGFLSSVEPVNQKRPNARRATLDKRQVRRPNSPIAPERH